MKKMNKKYRKAKGFTLVELLIVVIIIGILAGMMMLTAGSATDKAQAVRIVSDLRNIKSAAFMCYVENNTWPTALASIDTYMDAKIDTSKYTLQQLSATAPLAISYTDANVINTNVGAKLMEMKDSSGLYIGNPTTVKDPDYAGGNSVGMIIRKPTTTTTNP